MPIGDRLRAALPFRLQSALIALKMVLGIRPGGNDWFQDAGHEIAARGLPLGAPLPVFELSSKDLFCLALREGLRPTSAVLEVGCGCLRSGYHFVRFLEPGRYCGIEPNVAMLDAGRELILGPLESEKRPRFRHHDDFDFGVFETTFDFVVAFSIWSHASKAQIGTMLDQFRRTSQAGSKLISSWIPPRPGLPDYRGDGWVGRSHTSSRRGVVAHSREWLADAVSSRGLAVSFFEGFTTLGQHWLVATR